MKILVTGGAGYIGSVVATHLLRKKYEVVVLDNLSKGSRSAVPTGAEFIEGDIHDRQLLKNTFSQGVDAVMHFAAFIEAGESMNNPDKYFDNNLFGSYCLFSEVVAAGIQKVIFSSTAAVYAGDSKPLAETSTIQPANVYGQTKRMMEEILEWYHKTKGLQVCIFRYFNAAGSSLLGDVPLQNESHQPETHIIPNILDSALGLKPQFTLFGSDYPTDDGTCVRDYIHVDDLATAHLIGLDALETQKFTFNIFNLGCGNGFSNKEVLDVARKVTGHPIPITQASRRPGDAPRLVASAEKARDILGWVPQHTNLETIIESAWNSRKKLANVGK